MLRKTNKNVENLNKFCVVDSGKRKFITDEIAKLGKGNITSRIISYHELCVATQNFHPTNMIGEGGFGRVYKGYLKSTNEVLITLTSLWNIVLKGKKIIQVLTNLQSVVSHM